MKGSLGVSLAALLACTMAAAQTSSGRTGQAQYGSAQITNGPVAEYVTDAACTVGWSTNAPGKMILRYGPAREQMTQTADVVDSKDGRNHHAQLAGLQPNRQYFFEVVVDGVPLGNPGTFHTVASGETPIKSKAAIPQ